MGKKKDQRKHAMKRAKERYDLDLTKSEYKKLNKIIQKVDVDNPESNVVLIERQSNNRRKYALYSEKHEILFYVIYNKKYSQIQTFLPPRESETHEMLRNA